MTSTADGCKFERTTARWLLCCTPLCALCCHIKPLVGLPDESAAEPVYCRPRTACLYTDNTGLAWAGTTLSVLRVDGLMGQGCRMFDTPGVPHSHQLTSLLTLPEVPPQPICSATDLACQLPLVSPWPAKMAQAADPAAHAMDPGGVGETGALPGCCTARAPPFLLVCMPRLTPIPRGSQQPPAVHVAVTALCCKVLSV